MDEESREDIIIDNANSILEKIENNDSDNEIIISEYKNLLKSYNKLNKKYKKIVKIGDSYSSQVMTKNNDLQTFTRKKVLENVTSQREIKEEYTKELIKSKETIKSLNSKLEEVSAKYYESQKKLEKLVKPKAVFKNTDTEQNIYHQEINLDKFKSKSYSEILNNEIAYANKYGKPFVAGKITINGNIGQLSKDESTGTNILRAILKSINGSLKTNDSIYFTYPNIFYIVLVNTTLKDSKQLLDVLMKSTKLAKLDLYLSFGLAEFEIDKDMFDTILHRITTANQKAAMNNGKNSQVIELYKED